MKDNIKSVIKKNFTVPNFLSLIRILVIPPLIIFLLDRNFIMAGVMLIISGVSDMFDGMIARKFNQVTQLGKMLDPIADKLTLISVVICIYVLYPSVLPFVIILFAKEFLMLCGGFVLLKMKIKPPAAKWYGKVATVVFYLSVTAIILLNAIWGIDNIILTNTLLIITTVFMLFALFQYARIFFKLIKEKKAGISDESKNKIA
ncbi:MAG: CDP-alcohol phosphatidyltransferase family protein [Clostridia bacterium]|nr:CDP-alcohol phosphatidyltransferase family protein [Clostridia bacterium]